MLNFIVGFACGAVFASYYDIREYIHAAVNYADKMLEKR
jgi:hypothetical protein